MNTSAVSVVDKVASPVADPAAHVRALGVSAREAAAVMAAAPTDKKNAALLAMADAIEAASATLIKANQEDMLDAGKRDIGAALLDRLELTEARVASMAKCLRDVAAQKDPVGSLSESDQQPLVLKFNVCVYRWA